MKEILQNFAVRAVVSQRPKLGREFARRRLEKRRQINVVGAEAYAEFAQSRTGRLVEGFDLSRNLSPIKHAQRLDQLKGDPARNAADLARCRQFGERPQQPFDMGLEPSVEPRLDSLARRAGEMFIGDEANARPQRFFASLKFADRRANPTQRA